MKVRALTNLGGVLKAHAGEEFELTNEAQLQDLLQQGVVVPVENNPQEVAKAMNLSGEQLHEARQKQVQFTTLEEKARAEAQAVANNQKSAQIQEEQAKAYKQAFEQAQQKVQQQFESEQNIQQAEFQAEQQRREAQQLRATQEAQARQNATNGYTPNPNNQ